MKKIRICHTVEFTPENWDAFEQHLAINEGDKLSRGDARTWIMRQGLQALDNDIVTAPPLPLPANGCSFTLPSEENSVLTTSTSEE